MCIKLRAHRGEPNVLKECYASRHLQIASFLLLLLLLLLLLFMG